MAHFARITDNTVAEVIVVANAALDDAPYPQSEALGKQLLTESGIEGDWLQCSWSGAFRGLFPAQGYTYDPAADVFIATVADVDPDSPTIPEQEPTDG